MNDSHEDYLCSRCREPLPPSYRLILPKTPKAARSLGPSARFDEACFGIMERVISPSQFSVVSITERKGRR
jgi:hypothetical protein